MWVPEQKKDIREDSGDIQTKALVDWPRTAADVSFGGYCWVGFYQGSRVKGCGDVCYLCTFSLSLTLLQTKMFQKTEMETTREQQGQRSLSCFPSRDHLPDPCGTALGRGEGWVPHYREGTAENSDITSCSLPGLAAGGPSAHSGLPDALSPRATTRSGCQCSQSSRHPSAGGKRHLLSGEESRVAAHARAGATSHGSRHRTWRPAFIPGLWGPRGKINACFMSLKPSLGQTHSRCTMNAFAFPSTLLMAW